jgi:hypothetical protein
MSVKIEDLTPEAQTKCRAMEQELFNQAIPFERTYTKRTTAEQIALWAQGRPALDIVNLLRRAAGMASLSASENGYTVTNCDGINTPSPHQSGKAFDIVPLVDWKPTWDYMKYADRYRKIGEIGRALGLDCGQDWKPFNAQTGLGWDPPHYQLREG